MVPSIYTTTDIRVSAAKLQDCRDSAAALIQLLKSGIRARDIMTMKAFENAITVMMALGGSTNAVLHLLALAREAEVDLKINDFNRIADRVPLLGNLTPVGKVCLKNAHRLHLSRAGPERHCYICLTMPLLLITVQCG